MSYAKSLRPVVIDDASLIDGSGVAPVPNGRVIIEGQHIIAVGPKDTVGIPDGAEVISAQGCTILPGLTDMHVHGSPPWGRGGDLTGSNKDSDMALYVKNGVTSILFLGEYQPKVREIRGRIERCELPGPRIFSVGPMLHTTPPAWVTVETKGVDSPIEARRVVRHLVQEEKVDAILATQGITPPVLKAMVESAHELEVPVTGQIWRSSARDGVVAGMDGLHNTSRFPESSAWPLERVMNYKSVIERGTSRVHLWAEADWKATTEVAHIMAESGMFMSPELVSGEPKNARFDAELTEDRDWRVHASLDLQEAGGLASEYSKRPWSEEDFKAADRAFERFKEFTSIFYNAGGLLTTGTDDMKGIGGIMLHRELRIYQEIGLTPLQVIRASTRQAASALGRADIGYLYPGNLADLIVVYGDPSKNLKDLRNVRYVFVGGHAMVRDGIVQDESVVQKS